MSAAPTRASAAYALLLLFLVNMFSVGDRALLGIVTEPVKRDLALTDTQMSLANGFLFVSFNLLIGLFIARWVDRGNRKLILAAGLAIWSLATALTGLAHDFAVLALSRILVGAGEATVFPVALSMIADLFRPDARPRSISLFQSSTFVGLIGGSILAGVLAAAHGWRSMFVICGLAGLVLVVLLLLSLSESARGGGRSPDANAPRAGMLPEIRSILALPGFCWLAFGMALAAMGGAVLGTWGAAFLQRSHGVPLAQVGAIIGPAVGLGGIGGTIFSGFAASFAARRFGRERAALLIPIFALPVAAPFLGIFALTASLSGTMMAAAVMNFLLSAAMAPCMALSVTIVRPDQRGLAATLMLIATGLIGGALAPFLVGSLSDFLAPSHGDQSLRYALCTMVVPPVLASLSLVVAYRRLAGHAAIPLDPAPGAPAHAAPHG